jgi:hypothetical protein
MYIDLDIEENAVILLIVYSYYRGTLGEALAYM